MNDKVLKKTQDTLGKIVKKPPLTEKLLNKPPFRFLHDVTTSVIKSTGFMKGLFPEADLSSDNVKDKDSKIAFLQTAIDYVALVLNKSVSARPSKIVAGQEPEKTNEFLQALAEAINKKVKNDEYVKKFHAGDRLGKSKSSSDSKDSEHKKKKEDKEDGGGGDKDKERRHHSKEEREKSRDREKSKDRDKEKSEKDRGKDRDKEHRRDRERSGRDKERSRERSDKDRSREHGDKERSRDRDDREKDRGKRRSHREDKDENKDKDADGGENAEPQQEEAEQDAPARIPRPSSAKGARRRHRGGRRHSSDEDEEDERHRSEDRKKDDSEMNGTVGEDDLPPQVAAARKMARPSSARPAPPRIKRNEAQLDEPPVLGSGGSNVPNVIVDRDVDSDDDEDLFVAKEEDIHSDHIASQQSHSDLTEEGGEHGGLVKKILETKKELEGGSQKQQAASKKVEIEKPAVNDAARRKEREMVQKEIDKLRGSVQTLTRSANPLGKVIDYVQEDLDQMQKELEMWKRENKQNAVALQREQSITERSIEPLKAQLLSLEQQTQDQLDLLAAVKSNIYRNDQKIEKMLGSITKS